MVWYILLIIVLLSLDFNLIQITSDQNILTAIVCIDRDAHLSTKVYKALQRNNVNDILIVTRESDNKTIAFWDNKATVITVPHYDIEKRHNYSNLVKKRSIVLQHCIDKNYDGVWFVDSDIIPLDGTLDALKRTYVDICFAPYIPSWDTCACVGIETKEDPGFKIKYINILDKIVARKTCCIGGFGCTFIKKSAFSQKIEYKCLTSNSKLVYGEDIGFFVNCKNAGLRAEYLTRWIQPHHLKKL